MTHQIVFGHDNIWGYDESTWHGIDMNASETLLIEKCAQAFTEAGIDAELTISASSNSSVESDANEDQENVAIQIANSIWEQHDWYVDDEELYL